ncbi:MAG: TatD family hydrolase [archaeon]|nr:TatD family hydrolase [archaeon]
MIDTHCHIDFEDYDEDRLEVIQRAQDKLDAFILSGTSFEGNNNALKYANKYKEFIYPSLGYHPVSSQKYPDEHREKTRNHIIENIDDIVAIGEVGMDFFYVKDKDIRAKQRETFISFVEVANEYKKPLLIHARNCEKKALNIVNEYEDIPEVIFHCYSGSLKTARKIMDKGYYMSFSTMLCYSTRHQELIKEIPLEHVLTETDSPYLAMTKEERNEPANVINAGLKIASIKGIDYETVDKITTDNARRVFKI